MTPAEGKKIAYGFCVSPAASRKSANKNNEKRTRIGPKEYVSHQIHLLEKKKKQTDFFLDFKAEYPDFKMSQ